MLTLTRKTGQSFLIGDEIEISITEISGDKVKVAISAPKEIKILRKELYEAQTLNIEAAQGCDNPQLFQSILKKISPQN